MADFFEKSKIKFDELIIQSQEFLIKKYKQARQVFSPSSPYGQILEVVHNLIKLVLFYLEYAVSELSIYRATRADSVYGLARLSGHNPTRAISAQGAIGVKVKESFKGKNKGFFFVNNFTRLKNKTTGIEYVILLSQEKVKININSNEKFVFRVVQGKLETQTRVSDGTPLQSFNFTSRLNGEIENDHVWVYVNGERYAVQESLYDMIKGEKSCLVKTGIGGGIDVYFGNEDYGFIPPGGAQIKVEYLVSNGASGNIQTTNVDFEFLDSGFNLRGDEIDLNEAFDVSIEQKILMGSDGEELNITRLIAGSNSRSLVLAHPRNYIHFLSRYNTFSFIDAYATFDDDNLEDDNVIYLFLIPDVQKKLNKSSDYFTESIESFYLDEEEKRVIKRAIQESGRQIVTTELKIEDPIIRKFVINIYLRIFDFADEGMIRSEIISRLGEYFLNVKRRDKIPKSDLIEILEGIEGIDSVNLNFISQENEEAIRNGYYYKTVYKIDAFRSLREAVKEKVILKENEDPNLGLDEFGDIVIRKNELPLIRGGWEDRNGIYYEEGISDTELCSVNIFIKEVIQEDLTSKLARLKKEKIKKTLRNE